MEDGQPSELADVFIIDATACVEVLLKIVPYIIFEMSANVSGNEQLRLEKLTLELLNRETSIVVIETIICVVITGTSVVGNVLVMIALYRNPTLRRPSNLYIGSLAVSDIFLSSVAMPFTCISATAGRWIFGEAICWLQAALATMLGTTSLATMALIAANRLLKVVYPNTHRRLVSVKTILFSIVVAWCFTGAIPLSFYITGVRNVFHPGHVVCLFDFSSASYALIVAIAVFDAFLPYQIIFICYFKVWRFLRSHHLQKSSSHDHINVEEVKLNRLLAVIVLSFTICFTPFLVVVLIESFNQQFSLPRQVYFFSTVMVGTASCVNPVIYGVLNREFKREFHLMFRIRGRGARIGTIEQTDSPAN